MYVSVTTTPFPLIFANKTLSSTKSEMMLALILNLVACKDKIYVDIFAVVLRFTSRNLLESTTGSQNAFLSAYLLGRIQSPGIEQSNVYRSITNISIIQGTLLKRSKRRSGGSPALTQLTGQHLLPCPRLPHSPLCTAESHKKTFRNLALACSNRHSTFFTHSAITPTTRTTSHAEAMSMQVHPHPLPSHQSSLKKFIQKLPLSNLVLYLGAGLSITDLLFDFVMVREYYNADQPKFATATLVTIFLNVFFTVFITVIQHLKHSKLVILRECLFVVTFIKPGLDAHRVVQGKQHEVDAFFDPKGEMLIGRVVELFAECIPGAGEFYYFQRK